MGVRKLSSQTRTKTRVGVKVSEFYKVGYYYQDELKWACYFQLQSAQEAMMKMIHNGIVVTALETQEL